MIVSKRLRRATIAAASFATVSLAASADGAADLKTYDFSGTFTGVGALTGSFTVDYAGGAYTLKGLDFVLNGASFTTANSSARLVGSTLYIGGNYLQADGLNALVSNNDFSLGLGFNSRTGALTSLGSFRIVTTSSHAILRGGNLSLAAAAVPEPASWALMLAGFGLVGAAMRSRRTVSFRFA